MSLVVTCMLLPLVIIAVQFVRLRWQMRNPLERAVAGSGIASGVGSGEVIVVFALLFGATFVVARRLLPRS